MLSHWMRNTNFAALKGILSAVLLIVGATAQAATYPANSTNNCTGPKNCTLESWGIDLNDNTGYAWQVSVTQASAANVYIKAASLSGTRAMSLWVNNIRVATLSINSTTAPRPTGTELSAVSVQLISGTNTIELRDTENTTEFDAHHLRVETAVAPSSSSSSSSSATSTSAALSLSITNNSGRTYVSEQVSLSAAISSGSGWQYSWKLIGDGTYNRKDIYDLTWNSSWENGGYARCTPSNIGQRVSGKFYPPASGLYKFSVAADDMHELSITKNGVKQLMTSTSQATSATDFFSGSTQVSQYIDLTANTAYPFEFLFINNPALNSNNAAHFSVLWQKPGTSQWEEIPIDYFSKTDEATASGKLLQETFENTLTSLSQLKNLSSFINSRSNTANPVLSGQTVTFTPSQNKNYTFEVTATSGNLVVKENITFYAESRFISEDHASAATAWKKYYGGTLNHNQSGMTIGAAGDSSATGNVLQIQSTASDANQLTWRQDVYLEPYAAYEIRGRVRLLNPPAAGAIQIPESQEDSKKWLLPRVRVGVHGDASEQGINATNPTQWTNIAVDFVVPYHGLVDLYAHMGYTGSYQVDNLQLVKLTGRGATAGLITQFSFNNMVANVPDFVVTKTGGYAATKAYFARMSQAAENMRILSGKNFVAQCTKQNIFVPANWDVFAYGTNADSMILKDLDVLTDDFLQNVWGSANIVGGAMIHEIEHSFDFPDSNFYAHLPLFLQVYAMEQAGLKRTHNNSYLTAAEWIQSERQLVPTSLCGREAHHFLPKLFEFQDTYLGSNRWGVIKQIMHDRWSPYKILQGHAWAAQNNPLGQYKKWWEEINYYTGLDGWTLLHTTAERTEAERSFNRLANKVTASIDPLNVPGDPDSFYLYIGIPATTPVVGWGEIDLNNLVEVSGTCREQNIYAHATSSITYNIGKKWLALDTQAVIKNNSPYGLVTARIKGDGVTLYQSSSFTAQSGSVSSGVIDVSNVNQLTLEFLDGGDANSDWSVWIDPLLTKNSIAATKFASVGKAIKHSSGKCIAPEFGGTPAMNEKAVLTDDCTASNSKFKWLTSGALMHINSGSCLHPLEGSSTPSNGTYWVFFPNCDNKGHIQYESTSQKSIKHRSSTSCIHPEGGSGTPAAGTKLVFGQDCDQTRLAFTLQ